MRAITKGMVKGREKEREREREREGEGDQSEFSQKRIPDCNHAKSTSMPRFDVVHIIECITRERNRMSNAVNPLKLRVRLVPLSNSDRVQ